MKTKMIYSSWIPELLGVFAITLSNRIYFREAQKDVSTSLVRHELTHVNQIMKEGTVGFYGQYIYEYFKGRFSGLGHHKAYLNISYEIEARDNEV
jgi:hypothetical protein